MMKRLLFLRHAKTEPDNPKGDRARALTPRGTHDAKLVGQLMQRCGYRPDFVLASPSTRTRQTWQIIEAELGGEPVINFVEPLYLARPETIAALVRATPQSTNVLMIVGHNPGMADCAVSFARRPQSSDERTHLEALREKFPTCALAILDFDVARWTDLKPGCGELVGFVRPKSLRDG